MGNAEFSLRLAIVKRVVVGRSPANEPLYDWQETQRYDAKRLSLTTGEEIRPGRKEGITYLKVEIRGQRIPVAFDDRIKLVVEGTTYRVVGDPVRLRRSTVVMCESL